ncbi:hypothetical protein T484DRAFT_1741590 [Baffinella frigidus]|nr:hypothetical protein T484DRAFT_1741590 [Cryptophyta sp. CCMP2293]
MRTSRVVRAWLAAAVLLCAVPAGSRQHDRTSAAPLASALGGYSGGFSGACLQLRGGGRPKESSEKKTKKRREKKPSRDASDGEEKEKEVAVLQGRVEKRKGKGKEQPIVELGAVAKSKGASSWQHDSDEDVGEEASSESLTEALARQSNVVGEGTMIDDPRTVRQNNRWRDRRMRDAGVLPPAGTGKHPSVRPQLEPRPGNITLSPLNESQSSTALAPRLI